MTGFEEFASAAGLIVVLMLGLVVLRTLIGALFGRRRRAHLGLQLILLFGFAYLVHGSVLRYAGLEAWVAETGKVLAALLWFAVAFFVTGALNRYVWHGVLSKDGQPTVPRLLTDFVQVFIYLAAIMSVMHFVYDQSITALAATSGAFAFIVGYSAQSTLAELFAGISLNLARSIKKGDIVRIGETFGRVADVNWRCVSVMEPKSGSTVVMPNSKVAASDITNYSLPEPLYRRAVYFTAEFSAPADLVIRAVTEHLRRARSILSDPPPIVHVREYTALGTEFRALWYLRRDSDWWRSWNEAHDAIWAALRENGIQPGLNHRDAGAGGRFDAEAWEARIKESPETYGESLAEVPLFATLGKTALAEVAGAVRRHHLGVTDVMFERGDAGGALYVVVSGRIAMQMADAAGQVYTAAELGPGEVLGLAAVNGGEQRATAQAIQNAVVYEIDAATVAARLKAGRKFAAAVAEAARARAEAYEMGVAAFHREQAREMKQAEKTRLVAELSARIRGAFAGGLKATLLALVTGAEENGARGRLLEAVMAATALVASADGDVEAEEREHVVRTLGSMDLLSQARVTKDEALALFDGHCRDIAKDPNTGVAKALDMVGRIRADREGAELVIGVCVAVSAADGELEPTEEARIAELRDLLGVGGGDDVEG